MERAKRVILLHRGKCVKVSSFSRIKKRMGSLLAALETHSLFAASLRPVSNKHTHLPPAAAHTNCAHWSLRLKPALPHSAVE